MVTRIVDAGWPVVLWARRPEALEPFRGPAVTIADSPAALGAEADVIGICVWTDDDVERVVAGEGGVLDGCRPGTVVAIHSTVLPATSRAMAELAAKTGVTVLDAPVSGGRRAAFGGQLVVAVGGDAAAFERCQPVFKAFADQTVLVGDVGAGQVAKLLNNALLAANLTVADDALSLGESFGLDAAVLSDFLRAGSGRSYALDVALASRSSAATRQAALPTLEKDVESLASQPGSDRDTSALLRDAAEALRRLRHPPPNWQ